MPTASHFPWICCKQAASEPPTQPPACSHNLMQVHKCCPYMVRWLGRQRVNGNDRFGNAFSPYCRSVWDTQICMGPKGPGNVSSLSARKAPRGPARRGTKSRIDTSKPPFGGNSALASTHGLRGATTTSQAANRSGPVGGQTEVLVPGYTYAVPAGHCLADMVPPPPRPRVRRDEGITVRGGPAYHWASTGDPGWFPLDRPQEPPGSHRPCLRPPSHPARRGEASFQGAHAPPLSSAEAPQASVLHKWRQRNRQRTNTTTSTPQTQSPRRDCLFSCPTQLLDDPSLMAPPTGHTYVFADAQTAQTSDPASPSVRRPPIVPPVPSPVQPSVGPQLSDGVIPPWAVQLGSESGLVPGAVNTTLPPVRGRRRRQQGNMPGHVGSQTEATGWELTDFSYEALLELVHSLFWCCFGL